MTSPMDASIPRHKQLLTETLTFDQLADMRKKITHCPCYHFMLSYDYEQLSEENSLDPVF